MILHLLTQDVERILYLIWVVLHLLVVAVVLVVVDGEYLWQLNLQVLLLVLLNKVEDIQHHKDLVVDRFLGLPQEEQEDHKEILVVTQMAVCAVEAVVLVVLVLFIHNLVVLLLLDMVHMVVLVFKHLLSSVVLKWQLQVQR